MHLAPVPTCYELLFGPHHAALTTVHSRPSRWPPEAARAWLALRVRKVLRVMPDAAGAAELRVVRVERDAILARLRHAHLAHRAA